MKTRADVKDHVNSALHPASLSTMIDARNRIISAAAATIVAETLIAPTNIVRQKQMDYINAARQTKTISEFPSVMDTARNVMKQEGYKGFFHGFSSILLNQIGTKSLVLLSYEPIRNQLWNWRAKFFRSPPRIDELSNINKIKDKITQPQQFIHSHDSTSKSLLVCLLSGGFSGMIGYAIMHPQEALGSSGQTEFANESKMMSGSRRYGLKPNLMYAFLVYSTEFGGYDYLKSYALNSYHYPTNSNYNAWPIYLLSASTIGVISTFVCVSADMIRTRSPTEIKTSGGMIAQAMNKIGDEGIYSFRKKIMLQMTRKVVWLSGFFLTYEQVRRYLNVHRSGVLSMDH